MRSFIKIFLAMFILFSFAGVSSASVFDEKGVKEEFAQDVSALVSASWKDWQDSVLINGIEVDGARGVMKPGDMQGSFLTAKGIMRRYAKEGKAAEYKDCVKAIAKSLEQAMRAWQRGYSHADIPFPQGASCSFTLTHCNNVPVTIASGGSLGREKMKEKNLYSYMLYLMPTEDASIKEVMKAASLALSESFDSWEKTCSIVGIRALGGIAPSPAPMGRGPGPVRGAKGEGGKLVGPYLQEDKLYKIMASHYSET